jgi:hypothetical protein
MGDLGYIKVTVVFEQREDGGLRAYSEDVPGFVLSGPDANAVFEDVIPALEMLLLHNRGMRTNLKPVVGLRESMQRDGFLPPHQPKEIREYVSYAMAA